MVTKSPKSSQKAPGGSPKAPQRCPSDPKGSQEGLKRAQGGSQELPRGSQGVPKGAPRFQDLSPGELLGRGLGTYFWGSPKKTPKYGKLGSKTSQI